MPHSPPSMAYPEQYKSIRRGSGSLPLTVETGTETLPKELGPSDVVIKIHAVSLNFRDVGLLHGKMPKGSYPPEALEHVIIASDCAAEVVALGEEVRDFHIGDHVSPIFDLNDIDDGEEKDEYADAEFKPLGGTTHGVLREYAVFDEKLLVRVPKYLSWEEASTLTCAGVTAWAALDIPSDASKRNMGALMHGTGGVSMFALLLCIAVGIQPIITSSSNEKLAAITNIYPSARGINYKATPDVAAEARRITNGRGVDVVINSIGPASVMRDLDALRSKDGHVSLIGFLEGFSADWDPNAIMGFMSKRASLRGTRVGPKSAFIKLNDFLEQNKISLSPIIDRVFPFAESQAACDYLYSGKHVGKVVITI